MEVVVKIRSISAYQADLPLHEGSYNWSGGKSVSVFDSTIVAIETDEGVTGYGEVCPLGPFYLPAYAEGARTGIGELAPHLIGEDPTQLLPLNRHMDAVLKGHPYVKSAIDMACWDILGRFQANRSARSSVDATAKILCFTVRSPNNRPKRWRKRLQTTALKDTVNFN